MRTIWPYSTNTKPRLLKLSEDGIYTADNAADAARQVLSFWEIKAGNASAGLIGSIIAVVDKNASYSSVFSSELNTKAAPSGSGVHHHNS